MLMLNNKLLDFHKLISNLIDSNYYSIMLKAHPIYMYLNLNIKRYNLLIFNFYNYNHLHFVKYLIPSSPNLQLTLLNK